MVDLHCKTNMAISNIPTRSHPPPPLSTIPFPPHHPPRVPASSSIAAYESYLRLPDLTNLSNSKRFPDWTNESILKPSLQALETTFHLISIALSDSRPYSNLPQWQISLQSLTNTQLDIIATMCSDESITTNIPVVADVTSVPNGVPKIKSSQEVWKLNETTTVVSHTSEGSLLPRLASWDKSKALASKIQLQIECHMHDCPFTLGLGEPNLSGNSSLEYDLIVGPVELRALKKSGGLDQNQEDLILCAVHRVLELWSRAARNVLIRIGEMIDGGKYEDAAGNCWMMGKMWKLLAEIVDLHALMDPGDFLSLKRKLEMRARTGSEAFCFRSRALMEVTDLCKGLKDKVPGIVGVEVDPKGGPAVQEAVMRLFCSGRRGGGRTQLLQAFQAVEMGVKKFYFGYKQVMMAVMGSLEANGNRGLGYFMESEDLLTQMFLDPPYFPSVDAAKTFLGEMIRHEERITASGLDSDRYRIEQ